LDSPSRQLLVKLRSGRPRARQRCGFESRHTQKYISKCIDQLLLE